LIALSIPQQRIVDGIRAFWDERNIPPTVRDLSDQVGRSTSTVHYHLTRLQDLGVIEREPWTARSIRIRQPERTCDAVPST